MTRPGFPLEEDYPEVRDRLLAGERYQRVTVGGLREYLAGGDVSLLLLPGDPSAIPESHDVIIIFPEIVRLLAPPPRPGVVARADEALLLSRIGMTRTPALAFFRNLRFLGGIDRLRNWAEYSAEIGEILKSEGTPLPDSFFETPHERAPESEGRILLPMTGREGLP